MPPGIGQQEPLQNVRDQAQQLGQVAPQINGAAIGNTLLDVRRRFFESLGQTDVDPLQLILAQIFAGGGGGGGQNLPFLPNQQPPPNAPRPFVPFLPPGNFLPAGSNALTQPSSSIV